MTIFSGLKNFVQAFGDYDGTLNRQIHNLTGFPVVEETQLSLLQNAVTALYDGLIEERNFNRILLDFEKYYQNRKTAAGLDFIYNAPIAAFDRIVGRYKNAPEKAVAELEHVRQWWRVSGRSVSSSAIYAWALTQTAFAFRGDIDADKVTEENWEKQAAYLSQARGIFLQCKDRAGDNFLWHRNYMRFAGAEAAGVGAGHQRFERVQELAPHDLSLYTLRARQLLPQAGGSMEQLELFAQQSALHTNDRFGAMIYAHIYAVVMDEAWPWFYYRDTLCDWRMLAKGFERWMRLFPADSQIIANRYLRAANIFGDIERVELLCNTVITEYHPASWDDPSHAYAIFALVKDRQTA